MTTEKNVRLERASLGGQAFYDIKINQDLFGAWIMVRQWGVQGRHASMEKHTYVSYKDAAREANRLYKRKLANGYRRPARSAARV